jgi:hypothetical protein
MKVRNYTWWIVVSLGLIAYILAIVGFNILYTQAGVERNIFDLSFQSIKLFGMKFPTGYQSPLPWQLEVARWMAPAVIIYTAAKAILYLVQREYKSFQLSYKKDRIIVTSLNEKSRYLIKDLLKNGEKVIVLAGIIDARKLDEVEKEGAVIVEGDITSKKFLDNIGAKNARYFVFLEEDDETNISNAISVYNYLIEFAKDIKQTIFTHVADDIKLSELMELKFFEKYLEKNETNNNCEIRVFSMNERTSRVLFKAYSPDVFNRIKPDSPKVRIAVFGSGKLAQSMIIRLARLGHYANRKKIKITLFHDGQSIVKKLLQNFPEIQQLIEFENIDEPLELFDIEEFNQLQKEYPFNAVYLLCEDDSLSSNILKKLIKNDSKEQINVVMALMNPEGILSKWYNVETIANIRLHKFNVIEESFTKRSIISEKMDDLAKLAHASYLPPVGERNPEKASHKEWEYLGIDFKNQNREQADHLDVKVRALGCKIVPLDSPEEEFIIDETTEIFEILAETEHNRWVGCMTLSGWKLGAKRDDNNKIHTDLIPYEKLSKEVKQYDRDTVLNMRVLLEKMKLKMVLK